MPCVKTQGNGKCRMNANTELDQLCSRHPGADIDEVLRENDNKDLPHQFKKW